MFFDVFSFFPDISLPQSYERLLDWKKYQYGLPNCVDLIFSSILSSFGNFDPTDISFCLFSGFILNQMNRIKFSIEIIIQRYTSSSFITRQNSLKKKNSLESGTIVGKCIFSQTSQRVLSIDSDNTCSIKRSKHQPCLLEKFRIISTHPTKFLRKKSHFHIFRVSMTLHCKYTYIILICVSCP